MSNTALVVGASGIAGQAVATLLRDRGWTVAGLARNPPALPGIEPVSADLSDPASLSRALAELRPTHLFFTAWSRQATEAENIRVNAAMVRNVLDAVRASGTLQHAALVTGLKHYLGPFEAYATGASPATPFRETQPRLDVPNFYYAQEDELFEAAAREGFTWSVHRAHTIIGHAVGNAMNMGSTLATFAVVCRETGRPFRFPGVAAQWTGLTDMTDAGVLAEHLAWASTTPAAADQAFNIVNGDIFRWSWMWGQLASWFGIEAVPFDGTVRPLETEMANDAPVWREIAARHDLVEPDLDRMASPWHTDADLGRPVEVVTDMSKSRVLGFTAYKPTDQAFFDLFESMRADRLIP